MKHSFALLAAAAMALTAGAQAVESHKFFDNWSVGIHAGAAGSATAPFDRVGGLFGAELSKQITPLLGVAVRTTAGVNSTGSHTAVDNLTSMLLAKVNVSNWVWTYQGTPRDFDIEAIVGVGFNHYYGASATCPAAVDNTLASEFGLRFNYNFGSDKAWTVSLTPAIAYDLETDRGVAYDVNNAAVGLTAGLTYHFMTSNGKRHFTRVRTYDKSEVDGLNAKINDLRATVAKKDKQLRDTQRELNRVSRMLNDYRNQHPAGRQ